MEQEAGPEKGRRGTSDHLLVSLLCLVVAGALGWPASAAPRSETRILLNAGVIDTATPEAQARRTAALPAAGKAMRLVQYPGPIQPGWYADLAGTGVKIVTYIPENAYLVWGTGAQLAAVRKLPDLQWEGAYTPFDRIDPRTKSPTGAYTVQLVEDETENPATLALAKVLGTKPALEDRLLGYVNLRVRLRRGGRRPARGPRRRRLDPALGRAEEARRAPEHDRRRTADGGRAERRRLSRVARGEGLHAGPVHGLRLRRRRHRQRPRQRARTSRTTSASTSPATSPARAGWSTTASRGPRTPAAPSQGCDGHGTLNYPHHRRLQRPHRRAVPGRRRIPLRARRGSLRQGRLVGHLRSGTFTYPDYQDLQSRAYRDAMRVSTNSWGANTDGAYDTDAQHYDALVRDAQPTGSAVPAAGNQEMVIVFAAGNAGPGASTVGSPGTAQERLHRRRGRERPRLRRRGRLRDRRRRGRQRARRHRRSPAAAPAPTAG